LSGGAKGGDGAGGKPGGKRPWERLSLEVCSEGLHSPSGMAGMYSRLRSDFQAPPELWQRQEDALDAGFSLAATQQQSAQVCAVLGRAGPFRTAGSAVNHSSFKFCAGWLLPGTPRGAAGVPRTGCSRCSAFRGQEGGTRLNRGTPRVRDAMGEALDVSLGLAGCA